MGGTLSRAAHQIALPISFVDEVPCVASAAITIGIPRPSVVEAIIVLHQTSEKLDVNILRSQTRRRAQRLLQRQHKRLEPIDLVAAYPGVVEAERRGTGNDVDGHDGGLMLRVVVYVVGYDGCLLVECENEREQT